jgi:uncharacterized protein YggE
MPSPSARILEEEEDLMKTSWPALLAAPLLPLALFAQTPAPPVPREPAAVETVSVSGVGRATLTPDRATFSVGVQSVSTTVAAAVQENNTRVASVVAALRKLGATDQEIRTSHVSIYPQQDHQQGKAPRITGYQVSNTVTVTRGNPAEVGKFVQAAVDAGANTVSGVNFTVSDPARGREGALQAAFADARAKAEVLAKAAGRSVGRAVSITEGGAVSPAPPYPMARMAMMEAKVDVPVEPGAEELSFAVSVIFELR